MFKIIIIISKPYFIYYRELWTIQNNDIINFTYYYVDMICLFELFRIIIINNDRHVTNNNNK